MARRPLASTGHCLVRNPYGRPMVHTSWGMIATESRARSAARPALLIGLLSVWPAAASAGDTSDRVLEWAFAGSEEVSWEIAAATCADLVRDGHDDWRLPDIEELTLKRASVPDELAALLSGEGIAAWACNRPKPPGGPEAREIERIREEEAELERKLCEMEGGVHCDFRPAIIRSWQYRFDRERPDIGRHTIGSSLCVRGGTSSCETLEAPGILCVQALRFDGWDANPRSGVVLEGLGTGGGRSDLGRTSEDGLLCLSRRNAMQHWLIMACENGGCGALEPHWDGAWHTLVVDPLGYGRHRRRSRLCLSLRTSRGSPLFGARVLGALGDGGYRKLGTTRPSGRRCVGRERLEDVRVLLVCASRYCRAVPSTAFEVESELLLTLPEAFALSLTNP